MGKKKNICFASNKYGLEPWFCHLQMHSSCIYTYTQMLANIQSHYTHTDVLTSACTHMYTHKPIGTHTCIKLMHIQLTFCSGSETRKAVTYDWQFCCYPGVCGWTLQGGHFLLCLLSSTENQFSVWSGLPCQWAARGPCFNPAVAT